MRNEMTFNVSETKSCWQRRKITRTNNAHHRMMNVHSKDETDLNHISTDTKKMAWETSDGFTHEKRMTLTKRKNNTHKQRTLPNDERPFKGSNGHETYFRRISTDVIEWHSFFTGLIPYLLTDPLRYNNAVNAVHSQFFLSYLRPIYSGTLVSDHIKPGMSSPVYCIISSH